MVLEGWEVKPLSDFFKLKSGDTKPIDTSSQGLYGVYGGNGITGYSNYYNNNATTLVIGRVGEYCGCVYKVDKCWITDNALFIDKRILSFDTNYMFFLLTFLNLNQYKSETGQPLLNQTIIGKVIVPYVPKQEQQKIATILLTLERTIEATQKLIEKEKMVKKGLMANLLTNGIDEQGRIRSPQTHTYIDSPLGMIPEGWEVGSIRKLVKNLDSKRIPLKETDRQEIKGHYPYYGASGIIDWVNDYIFDGEYILLGEDGENVVSRVLPLAFKASGKFWVNNHAHVFEPLKGTSIDYVIYLLENTDYKRIINGSAQPKITQDGLDKINFLIAPTSEQHKIATILSAQDRNIETEEINLAKLQNLKKGLMGDLLSGDVRVKV